MNTEDTAKLQGLIQAARLGELHPFKMNSEVLAPPPAEGVININTEVGIEWRAPSFLVVGRFLIAGKSRDDVDYLKMEIGILARYDLATAEEPPKALLAEFASRNGILDIWPMLRVLVLSACGQLGIPPIMVPLVPTPSGAPDTPKAQTPTGEPSSGQP